LHFLGASLLIFSLITPIGTDARIGGQSNSQVEQPPDVVEAYAVCREFQRVLAEDLDFDSAFEATFVKSPSRRLAIAMSDGEFGDQDFAELDGKLLIRAYKLRMELLYLMMPLAGPSDAEQAEFFPPEIKAIFQREPGPGKKVFENYVLQLDADVKTFRTHLENLARRNPLVAERIRSFKAEADSPRFVPPIDHKIEAQTAYFGRGQVLKDEAYYEIESYRVVKEDGKMRIVGLRFFTRMF